MAENRRTISELESLGISYAALVPVEMARLRRINR
jgi:hypothetical protein